jgi:hypothetical protein
MATAKSATGIQMCLTTSGTPAPANDISPTAIAAGTGTGAAASVIVTAPTTGLAVGDVIEFAQDVGFSSIAGKSFVVTKLNGATGFEIGNVKLGTGTMKAGTKIGHFITSDMQCLCLSEFSVSIPSPQTLDASTFCGPATVVSAKQEAGSASAAGYLDSADLGYQAILAASEDGVERILRVKLGTDNGYLVMPVTISGLGWTLPLDGLQSYSFTFAFSARPAHLF